MIVFHFWAWVDPHSRSVLGFGKSPATAKAAAVERHANASGYAVKLSLSDFPTGVDPSAALIASAYRGSPPTLTEAGAAEAEKDNVASLPKSAAKTG